MGSYRSKKKIPNCSPTCAAKKAKFGDFIVTNLTIIWTEEMA